MKYSIPEYTDEIPRLSTRQMIEVDRLMIEEYNIQLIQMMENAGRCLAILAMKRFFSSKSRTKAVIILAGTGNNGGGALVCGRRLANWGCEVKVYLTSSDHMKPIPKHQLAILRNMGVDISSAIDLPEYANSDLIIDGIIGYSIHGDPSGPAKNMIEWANKSEVPVTALDTPSGIDLSSGKIHSPSIKADATLTLALPKQGLYDQSVKKMRGELYLGDISVPPSLYTNPSLDLKVDFLFQKSDILRID